MSDVKELIGTSWEFERDYYMDWCGEGQMADKITFLNNNKLEIVELEPMDGNDIDDETYETGPWKLDGNKIEISLFDNHFILKGELKRNNDGFYKMVGSYTSEVDIKAHSENTKLSGEWRAFTWK